MWRRTSYYVNIHQKPLVWPFAWKDRIWKIARSFIHKNRSELRAKRREGKADSDDLRQANCLMFI